MVLTSIAVLGKEVWRVLAATRPVRPLTIATSHATPADPRSSRCIQNNPLYIRAFGRSQQDQSENNLLRFHFIVHTALDFVEEKSKSRLPLLILLPLEPLWEPRFPLQALVFNSLGSLPIKTRLLLVHPQLPRRRVRSLASMVAAAAAAPPSSIRTWGCSIRSMTCGSMATRLLQK